MVFIRVYLCNNIAEKEGEAPLPPVVSVIRESFHCHPHWHWGSVLRDIFVDRSIDRSEKHVTFDDGAVTAVQSPSIVSSPVSKEMRGQGSNEQSQSKKNVRPIQLRQATHQEIDT